ncbi:MAG: YiiX/YebB-like N1pC/P60 family cysteine hydrolase, partial [Verrucomicrobia bacterium]|nr:YiiX/YebB-like N1pC/P60 family cysteine hydrolase [Verrucomicrobiota bacterium]
MRFLLFLLISLPLHGGFPFLKSPHPDYDLQVGDIVFQATGGAQCEAIRAATNSQYSHCGVVFSSRGELHVLEAVSPVRTTPLEVFRKRSLRGTFHARRLKDAETALTRERLDKAVAWTNQNLGKPYDVKFLWS